MGLARPRGEHAEQMLDPGGWPEVDEDTFYDRALHYTEVLRRVTEVLETCRHQQGEIFDGGIWSGGAASAANGELGMIVSELMTLQNGLATVITWQRYIGASIVQAKSSISDNVEVADKQINALENDAILDAAERTTAINMVVGTTYGANRSVVEAIADQILASKAWKPPDNALDDLLDQKTPPPPVAIPVPAPPVPVQPGEPEQPLPGPVQPAPVSPAPVSPAPPPSPAQPPQTAPGVPEPGVTPLPPSVTPPPTGRPSEPPSPAPGRPNPAIPGSPDSGPAAPIPEAPGEPAVPVSPAPPLGPAAPTKPAASTQPPSAGERGRGVAPASTSQAPQSASKITDETSAAAAPAGPSAVPPIPAAPGGASAGRGAGSAAPVGQKPSGAQPNMRPAAAKPAAARTGAAERPTSTEHTEPPDSATIAPIPVSATRAARDAVADASTADAARRQGDPLRLARHIAAALNAPVRGGEADFGFFWVTAVTSDGAIVVANSYGLAYIPEGVRLPELVHMASADDAIPVPERARWATYPIMAVQGWAARRDVRLRAVIGTEEQLANSDPGAAKIVLKPDDIPETGDMVGRTRLVVVDPGAANRLGATPDPRLIGLLPPAPVDANPPADRRPELWFDVMKPMMSRASGREVAHLRAFHTYAAHVQEVLFAQAHIAAADPVSQRSAIADWLYWKRLHELLNTALVDAT